MLSWLLPEGIMEKMQQPVYSCYYPVSSPGCDAQEEASSKR